jgi:hypothetical protein
MVSSTHGLLRVCTCNGQGLCGSGLLPKSISYEYKEMMGKN